jgi:hypothetical protein
MTDLDQVIDYVKLNLVEMDDVVAAMKQTNTNMVPLRQQILVMWRDRLSNVLDRIKQSVVEIEALTSDVKSKKVSPEFKIKKKK